MLAQTEISVCQYPRHDLLLPLGFHLLLIIFHHEEHFMIKTIQLSKDNPGWTGKGIPTGRQLVSRLFRESSDSILQGHFSLSFYRFQANFVNWYHFILGKKQKKVECPCCGWQGPAFISTGTSCGPNYQARCPICDSRSRHRGLAKLLPNFITEQSGVVLVFAPEKVLLNVLEKIGINYKTTDLFSVDVDFPGEDIQSLSFGDNSFDWIMCNHVLEHVPNDLQAMKECYRVLKKDGKAIFTIPGNYEVEETVVFARPDGNGHHRLYGKAVVNDFTEAGFNVETIDMGSNQAKKWGIRKGDVAFVCSREKN